jgi:hypothetical protein
MSVQAIASAWPDEPLIRSWTADHHVAPVARRHCDTHEMPCPPELRIGGVACREAWERAICDDLAFALECGLPLDIKADPTLIDDVAVERAVRAADDPIEYMLTSAALTELERHEVRRRLDAIRDRRNARYRFVCSRAAAKRRAGGER